MFTDEIKKVPARGQTPAGMHRPICVDEILSVLNPKPGELFLDATLGFGGHAEKIVTKLLPHRRLFAIDIDPIELPRPRRVYARPDLRKRPLSFEKCNKYFTL